MSIFDYMIGETFYGFLREYPLTTDVARGGGNMDMANWIGGGEGD